MLQIPFKFSFKKNNEYISAKLKKTNIHGVVRIKLGLSKDFFKLLRQSHTRAFSPKVRNLCYGD